MHDIRSVLCQHDMGDIGYKISDDCMVITDLGGFKLSVAEVIAEVFATEGIDLNVKVAPFTWLDQHIAESPEYTPPPNKDIKSIKVGAEVTHRDKPRLHGKIADYSKGMITILNNFERYEKPMTITQFYQSWLLL